MLKLWKERAKAFVVNGYGLYDRADLDNFTFVETMKEEPVALVVLKFSEKDQRYPSSKSLKNKKLKLWSRNDG
jgi:hypothetical protein